jgi:hypothetical protein
MDSIVLIPAIILEQDRYLEAEHHLAYATTCSAMARYGIHGI